MMAVKAYFKDGTIREFDSYQEIIRDNLWFTWDVMGRINVFNGVIKPIEYYKEAGARDIKLIDAKGEIRKVPLWGSWLNGHPILRLDNPIAVRILAECSTWEEVDKKIEDYREIESIKGQIRLIILRLEKLIEKIGDRDETIKRHIIGLDKALEEVGMR